VAATAAIVARQRGPARLLIAGAALAGLLMIVILGALAGAGSDSGSSSFEPSAVAIADIPGNYLVAYQRAGMLYGVDWAILAAIGKMECDHGRSSEEGCAPGTVNAAGAAGPMQFLAPTWRKGAALGSIPSAGPPTAAVSDGYATDGDGNGIADIWNPYDAVAAAARYLRANGAPAHYQRAIFAYNHSQVYVDRVLAKAAEYRGAFAPGATGTARTVLLWAVAHVGRYTYSQGGTTDRGLSVARMQTHEPSGTTCDCSMFVRWAMAQAGLDVGHTTVDEWYAGGLLPNAESAAVGAGVVRGVGADPPPGGYMPGDMIFFGHGAGNDGHVALYLGDGQLVQCSSSGGGSNIRPLAGYVRPTGWVRWHLG
jgi:cell wall-associated NlpC family hydrolase